MSFTRPFAPHQLRPGPRAQFLPSNLKRRKRSSPSPPALKPWDGGFAPTSIAVQATNPLSLTPSETSQWRVAGLPLDQPHPSSIVPQFPHRRLPRSLSPSKALDDENEEGEEKEGDGDYAEGRSSRKGTHHLRSQHLDVLVAILHRCLLEGDIPRASRAWALLLRSESGGKPVDIKESGYWSIGAELLVRGGEMRAIGKTIRDGTEKGVESDSESLSDDEASQEEREGTKETRWGTNKGWEKARDYYERLILQYPYKRQFSRSVGSLDFWPAMIACEIYGIQYEQKRASQQNEDDEQLEPDEAFSDIYNDTDTSDDDATDAVQHLRFRHDSEKQADTQHTLADKARHTALVATSKLAARMDELMEVPPYSDSGALLKLRAMIALYNGNLIVPDMLHSEDSGDEEFENHLGDSNQNIWERRSQNRRMLLRQKRAEHERGLPLRREMWNRAMELFEKSLARGADCKVEMARLAFTLGWKIERKNGKFLVNRETTDGDEVMEDIYNDSGRLFLV